MGSENVKLKFETWLCDGDCVATFDDPGTKMIFLGMLTEEELGCIMRITARKGYWVLTRPAMAETED